MLEIEKYLIQKIEFEREIEKVLAHCPNMNGEKDLRKYCAQRCKAYYWCVSLEPAGDSLP